MSPLRRALVGGVSGAVAGFGLQAMFAEYESTYYGTQLVFYTLPIWMLVGAGLTAGGLALAGDRRCVAAASRGFVLWILLGICSGMLGVFSLEIEVLRVVTVLVAALAHALGAAVTTPRYGLDG